MQLTPEQIEYLFSFTSKKLVHWYDLQVELVDHLACRIEEELAADPSLSFESALEIVYKAFGIFGFAKIVQEKQAQLQRQARKIWWNEMALFFRWPKAALLLLVGYVLWQLAIIFDPNVLMIIFEVLYIFGGFFLWRYHLNSVKSNPKLLLLQSGLVYIPSVSFIFQAFIIFRNFNFTPLEFCIYATIGILIELSSFRLYSRVKEKAKSLYRGVFV